MCRRGPSPQPSPRGRGGLFFMGDDRLENPLWPSFRRKPESRGKYSDLQTAALLRRSLTDLKFPSWYSPPVARRRNALLPRPIMMYSLKNQLQYSLWNTKHPMIGRQFQITRNQIDTNRDFHAMRAYPPHPKRDFAKNSVHEIEQPLSFFFLALHTLLFNFRLVFFNARRVPEARFELARGIPSQDFKSREFSGNCRGPSPPD